MNAASAEPPAKNNSFGRLMPTGAEVLTFLNELPNDKSVLGITCTGKTDGGGAQVLAVMSALAYAEITGVPYFHTPFFKIMFDDGAPDWAGRWEQYFNLGFGETPVPEDATVMDASQYVAAGRPANTIIRLPHCHNYIHQHGSADAYSDEIRDELRVKYFAAAEKPRYDRDYIGLHVRRGDVSATTNTGRFMADDRIVADITKFRSLTGLDLPIEVFSQGEAAAFEFLAPHNVSHFHLNVDVFETIHRMVCAKGLIMGRSAFSYLAALLGDGEVMTDLWYHQPLSPWWVTDRDGLVIPWERQISYKERTRDLAERLRVDPQSVIDEVENDQLFRSESPRAQWFLALALLRTDAAKGKLLLEELAAGTTGVSEPARKTLQNRFGENAE